jgi:hypothetical protein
VLQTLNTCFLFVFVLFIIVIFVCPLFLFLFIGFLKGLVCVCFVRF